MLRGGQLSLLGPCGDELATRTFPFPDAAHRPFLKWTGGKQWLAPLADFLRPPAFSGTYREPFLGGGALFFALAPNDAVLGDLNEDLVVTYRAVRDNVSDLIALLGEYPHDRSFYDRIRRAKPQGKAEAGARLVYLNKTAFNGMYRVNSSGEFNVPFGRYAQPTICPSDRLRAASAALRGIELRQGDFAATVAQSQAGDWVYLDPPYITGHQNNGFRKYNARLFAWDDQERLVSTANALRARGVHVLVSNADHLAISELYQGWHSVKIERTSLINADADRRGPVGEVLISSYPLSFAPPWG